MISFPKNYFPALSVPAVLALLAASAISTFAATVATVPVGYIKYDLPSAATTAFGLPIDDTSLPAAGIRAGKIEAFTVNTITQSGGGWTGSLASASAPWLVRITSGPSAGKTLDVTANTTTTLTVSGADLTTLGLTAGTDTFELVPLDTLFGVFGTASLQGGTSAATADQVQVRSGTSWLVYYFDTNLGFWRRTIGPATNSNNVVLRPQYGVQVLRRGSPLTLTFTGRAPALTFRAPINNAGSTVIHSGFPTDTTLGSLAVQTLLPGWGGTQQVALYNGSTWVPYVFNGSFWQPASGPATNSDGVAIPATALLTINRSGATSGTTDLVRTPPYSL